LRGRELENDENKRRIKEKQEDKSSAKSIKGDKEKGGNSLK
jgi:hypothetical protein